MKHLFKISHIPEAAQICDLCDRTVRLSQKSGSLPDSDDRQILHHCDPGGLLEYPCQIGTADIEFFRQIIQREILPVMIIQICGHLMNRTIYAGFNGMLRSIFLHSTDMQELTDIKSKDLRSKLSDERKEIFLFLKLIFQPPVGGQEFLPGLSSETDEPVILQA